VTTTALERRDYLVLSSYVVHAAKDRLRELWKKGHVTGQKPPFKESDAHLYLLLATYVPSGMSTMQTVPFRLREAGATMHVRSDAVRKSMRRLVELGEIAVLEGGQGISHIRIKFLKLSGPMWEGVEQEIATTGRRTREVPLGTFTRPPMPPPVATESSASPSETEAPRFNFDPRKVSAAYIDPTDRSDLDPTERSSVRPPFVGSKLPANDYVLDIEEKERTSPSVLAAEANRFLHWWAVTVRGHTRRAPGELDLRHRRGSDNQTDWDILLELLEHYPLKRLKAMTFLAWTIEPDGRRDADWIAGTDASIRVISQKAIFLNDEVDRRQAVDPDASHETFWEQICERLRARLDRHTVYTWFDPCRLVRVCDDLVIINAQSEAHRVAIGAGYLFEALKAAVEEVLPGRRIELAFGATECVGTAVAAKRRHVEARGRRQ
jgi:hypothetical protein